MHTCHSLEMLARLVQNGRQKGDHLAGSQSQAVVPLTNTWLCPSQGIQINVNTCVRRCLRGIRRERHLFALGLE